MAGSYRPVFHPFYLQMAEYKFFKVAGYKFQQKIETLEGMYSSQMKGRTEALQVAGMYE